MGILCVAVFFFYSGYGLTISLRNKKNYMQGFIRKRFLTILVPYLMIAFIYWIWSAMNGNPYSIISLIIVGSIVLAYICNWIKKPKHLFGLTKLLPAKAKRNKE